MYRRMQRDRWQMRVTAALQPLTSQLNFAALFEAAPHSYVVLSRDFTIVAVSNRFLREARTIRDDVLGKNILGDSPASYNAANAIAVESLRTSLEAVLRSRTPDKMPIQKYNLPRPGDAGGDLEERHWEALNTPVLDADGDVVWIIHSVENVTQTVMQEHERDARLRRLKKQFQATFEQVAVGIIHLATDGRFLRVNSRFCDLVGYSADELLASRIQDITHPDDREATRTQGEALLQGSVPHYSLEKRYIAKDGRTIWVNVTRSLARDSSGQPDYFVAVIEEISARRSAVLALQEREARLRSIIDTAPEAVIAIDEQGRIETFSQSAEDLFGYTSNEVIGQNISILMPVPYRDEHDSYLRRYRRTGEKRVIGLGRVVSAQRKDGTIFPVELSVGEAQHAGRSVYTGFLRDLTASEKIEQQLRQAQKMEAVGQLTGGIAHDFNNLLTVILGNLEMLETQLTDSGQIALVAEAHDTALQGAHLTQRLLAFGRRQPLQPKLTDVGSLSEDFGALLRRTLGESVEVVTLVRDGPHRAMVDPSQLQNAMLNLAINARDAMPSGGKFTVEIRGALLDTHYASMHPDVPIGHYVLISVTDNGTGMSQDVRERAFEPFFTTKPVGAGSGLGLSMVYGFAKQSGGHVQIYSDQGQGTTVRLFLPSASADPTSEAVPTATSQIEQLNGRGEAILVVEDDPRVRRATVARLTALQYNVIEAENATAALAMMENAHVDLLFTDIVMPGGLTGVDLAKELRARRPGIKVLFASGYAAPEIIWQGRVDGGEWLEKPYTTMELARTLQRIFGCATEG